MNNCVSINLKKDQIVIKIAEDAEQKQIIASLSKKLPDLKKLYKDDKTPIMIVGKVLKNKEIDEIQNLIKEKIDVFLLYKDCTISENVLRKIFRRCGKYDTTPNH